MKKLLLGACIAALAAGAASAGPVLVGSYWVGAGPEWGASDTISYSAKDAAALLFGGTASDYAISIFSDSITNTAWYDGYGDTSHLKTDWFNGNVSGTALDDDFKLGDATGHYNSYPSFSAFVRDHDGAYTTADDAAASINYVWRLDSAVPEPASWALMLGGFGWVGGAMRSRRKVAVSFG